MRHKFILNFLLIVSCVSILVLYFFESCRIPLIIPVNAENANKLIENLSLAYISSYLFYIIVVYWKERDEKKVIYPFVADYTYVLMNKVILFSSECRSRAKLDYVEVKASIFDRNINIYPNSNEVKTICKEIDPNKIEKDSVDIDGLIQPPHFFGLMIKYSHDVDYLIDILLQKSAFLDTNLIRILTDIKTSGYHKCMTSYSKDQLLNANHRHNDLKVFEKSFNNYFDLFRKLEDYADENLQRYVERTALKRK